MRSLRLVFVATCVALLSQFATPCTILSKPLPSQASQPMSNQPGSMDALTKDFQQLANRVQQLELSAARTFQSSLITAIIAGSAALVAVLLAGGLTLLSQHIMAKREEQRVVLTAQRTMELARQEALYRHGEKILEFRLKQMELFYAPMFALLEQSKALYDKMLHQLAYDAPTQYKLLPEADPDGYRFHVLAKDGLWKGFRLLDQLPAVRTNPKALALVESILLIGEEMTKIISEHAGLASEDLAGLLGEYLAHYAILSTIHKCGETEPYEPGWHKMGYYPRDLNLKIAAGYHELSQFLDEYSKASKHMLEALPMKKS